MRPGGGNPAHLARAGLWPYRRRVVTHLRPPPAAGRHIHREDAVKVFGKHAFYDNTLNNERSFLAGDWGRKTVAFTGHCALQVRQRQAAAVLRSRFPPVASPSPLHRAV